MPKGKRRRAKQKAGLSPGTLIYVGESRTDTVSISLFDYDRATYRERQIANIEECFPYRDADTITWINIDGLHDVDLIRKLGSHYDIHPLVLEDVLHTHSRPKLDDYGNYLFVVIKMIFFDSKREEIVMEHVSLIIGKNFVISFGEVPGDVFDSVRERIRGGKGRIRTLGSDYLAYALMDAIVDNYFVILEKLEDEIDALDEEMFDAPGPETLEDIHARKKDVVFLRKIIQPVREIILQMQKSDSPIMREGTDIFLRDLYDHTLHVIEAIETSRDILSSMTDLYMSTMSNQASDTMRVLTVLASVFIPLTFIVGIWGMNFESMPELKWEYGYTLAWGVILLTAIVMLLFLKRKHWI